MHDRGDVNTVTRAERASSHATIHKHEHTLFEAGGKYQFALSYFICATVSNEMSLLLLLTLLVYAFSAHAARTPSLVSQTTTSSSQTRVRSSTSQDVSSSLQPTSRSPPTCKSLSQKCGTGPEIVQYCSSFNDVTDYFVDTTRYVATQ